MQNFVQPGDTVTLTAPAGGVTSGQPVLIGSVFGVATADAAAGDPVEVCVSGVFDLPKTTGAGTGFTAGDRARFDVSAGAFDATQAAVGVDGDAGIVLADAGDNDATVRVLLTQPFVTV